MEFYEILNQIMEEKQLSIADVAHICDLTDSTVRSIFDRHQKKIALNIAFKLAAGLDVSLERLNGQSDKEEKMSLDISSEALRLARDYEKLDEHGKTILQFIVSEEKKRMCETNSKDSIVSMPKKELTQPEQKTYYVIGGFYQPMSAGTGTEAGDGDVEEFILVKQPPRGASYVAPVSGDSMKPTFQDGDRLFIQACDQIEPGRIGVFFMDGKQWVKELGDGVLISHNPAYAPIPITPDIRCQGLVLGVCDPSYFG